MLKQKLQLRLGNKKAYWIKVFASKTRSKVLCEVRINGREDSELSELLLPMHKTGTVSEAIIRKSRTSAYSGGTQL